MNPHPVEPSTATSVAVTFDVTSPGVSADGQLVASYSDVKGVLPRLLQILCHRQRDVVTPWVGDDLDADGQTLR